MCTSNTSGGRTDDHRVEVVVVAGATAVGYVWEAEVEAGVEAGVEAAEYEYALE
jgi:hypothetical protein